MVDIGLVTIGADLIGLLQQKIRVRLENRDRGVIWASFAHAWSPGENLFCLKFFCWLMVKSAVSRIRDVKFDLVA